MSGPGAPAAPLPREAVPPGAWWALRTLLVSGRPAPGHAATPREVAAAAAHGGVVVLAVEADPSLRAPLQPLLDAWVHASLVLERAEALAAEALAAAGVDRLALLKGAATARLCYDAPAQRERSDVDLLVADEAFEAAVAALLAAGWEDVTSAAIHGGAARPFERNLVRELGGHRVSCDLHRRLLRWEVPRVDHAGVLDRARAAPGCPLPVCDPVDALLHTAIHAVNDAFRVPLRAFLDVARLLALPEVTPARLAQRAGLWRARTATWAALRVARRWLGAPAAPALLDALAPPAWQARALDALLDGDGHAPLRDAHAPRVAGLAARLLAQEEPARWLRGWLETRQGRAGAAPRGAAPEASARRRTPAAADTSPAAS